MDRVFSEPFKPFVVTNSSDDSESRARDSLFLMARLRTPSLSETFTVRIRNLSAGGLMAEFDLALDRDTPVEVEVRGIGWLAGRIAWFIEGRTGIAFNKPIDPQRARRPLKIATNAKIPAR